MACGEVAPAVARGISVDPGLSVSQNTASPTAGRKQGEESVSNPRRPILAILAISILALAAAACSGGAAWAPTSAPAAAPTAAAAASTSSSGEIKIGGIFNVTGQNASQAEIFMKAAKLAVKQINDAGGINGKKINLVVEDAQSTNPGALAALQRSIIEKQYRTLGAPYQFMGDPGTAEADTLALAKDAATGIYAVIDYMPGVTPEDKKYLADYAKEYNGEAADTQAAYNYDAIYLFANAIKKVGEDRAKIREAILGIHGDWSGACGTYDFTPNGDGLHANTVIQVESGGKYKFIQVVKVPPKAQ